MLYIYIHVYAPPGIQGVTYAIYTYIYIYMRRPAYRVLHIAPPGIQGVTYACNILHNATRVGRNPTLAVYGWRICLQFTLSGVRCKLRCTVYGVGWGVGWCVCWGVGWLSVKSVQVNSVVRQNEYSVHRIHRIHRTPYTVSRTPYTLHFTPYTLHLNTFHLAPYTVHLNTSHC